MSGRGGPAARGRDKSLPARAWSVMADGAGFPLLMLCPMLAVLGLVVGAPMVKAIWLSFDTVALRRPQLAGTYGLHNYERLLADADAWAAVAKSLLYMGGTVAGSVALGLAAALLTFRVVRLRALARLAFILPWSIPAVVTALVWGVMYEPNFGVINRILDALPLVEGGSFLIDRETALPALVVAQVWNEFPVAYLFFLAGLHAIPEELHEAARIDRASPLQEFLFVTLPQLRFVTAVVVILLLIMGFKAFPIIFILTGGGPAGATETLTVLTYNTAFRGLDFSYAATLGILAVAISLVLVIAYLSLTRHGARERDAA